MYSKNYLQAKADVLRSSKRQSFESPMMGSLKLFSLVVCEYSDETDFSATAQDFYTISWALSENRGGTDRALNAQSPPNPPVWRDKGKRFKGYSWLTGLQNGSILINLQNVLLLAVLKMDLNII